jgi:hypothetical protein
VTLFDQILNRQDATKLEAAARTLRLNCRHGAIECDCYERANEYDAEAKQLRGEQ